MALLVLLQFFAILLLLYVNRGLYWRSLLLEVQLRMLRKRFKRPMHFTENFRRLWVWARRLFGDWESVCILPKPSTVLDWHRRRFRDYWTFKSNPVSRPGRPGIPEWVKNFIVRAARENPRWGPAQIKGQLLRLHKFRVHLDTVRKHMPKREPDPLKSLRWREFLRLHMPSTVAMDFFLIKRTTSKPLLVLVMLHHETRRILHINLRESPDLEWLKQQFLLGLGELPDKFPTLTRVLCDNDPLFKAAHEYAKEMFDLNIIHTAVHSPWQNPFVERVIRTIREELTDFMLPVSKTILLQRLLEYKQYYNDHRTHTSLDSRTPANSANTCPGPDYQLTSRRVVGGLHRVYAWAKAA